MQHIRQREIRPGDEGTGHILYERASITLEVVAQVVARVVGRAKASNGHFRCGEGINHMDKVDLGLSGNRRRWLSLLGGCTATLLLLGARSAGQTPHPPGTDPAAPGSKEDADPAAQPSPKLVLQANDKDIKKSVEKLFQL